MKTSLLFKRRPARLATQLLAALAALPALSANLRAQVTASGDFSPVPVSSPTWNVGTDLTIRNITTGNLTISGNGSVSNTTGYIGRQPGSTGLAEASGGNWRNSGSLIV